MIQQKLKFVLSINFNSSPIFCLAIPENFMASVASLHTKKIESCSLILQVFINSNIAFSEKNFEIGPFPIILFLLFSNVHIYDD